MLLLVIVVSSVVVLMLQLLPHMWKTAALCSGGKDHDAMFVLMRRFWIA